MKTFALICCLVFILKGHSQSFAPFSILIHEIMADPTPTVELPNAEYIELKNNSKITIDLLRWKIKIGNNVVSISQSYALQPDSLVVLCAKSQWPLFNLPQKSIGLSSFPALPNEEGILSLISPDGETIHGIAYQSSMHENSLKSNGGWSLEMIDSEKPCSNLNLYSSQHPRGGTPGFINTVTKKFKIPDSLFVKQCFALDSKNLILELNQGVDSIGMTDIRLFNFDTSVIRIIRAEPLPPLFSTIHLQINPSLQNNFIYTLKIEKLISCQDHASNSTAPVLTGIPKDPEPKDIILNEILYDPPQEGADFIELLNTSKAIINLKSLYAANRINFNSYSLPINLSENNQNILPGELIVISTDTGYIKRQWPNSTNKQLHMIKQLPSLPNGSGSFILLNHQGNALEEFHYSDDMHFSLLRNTEGVSLERIHSSESAMNPNNWHSAAASANYATPTLENSQNLKQYQSEKQFELSSEVISPDNDGYNDILNLSYQFNQAGYLLSASLFNMHGKAVAKIFNNELCASSGNFSWDGVDQQGDRIPSGIYILFVEAIHKSNKPIQWKKTIAVKRY